MENDVLYFNKVTEVKAKIEAFRKYVNEGLEHLNFIVDDEDDEEILDEANREQKIFKICLHILDECDEIVDLCPEELLKEVLSDFNIPM